MRLAWFNSAFLKDQIRAGQRLVVYGTFERNQYSGLQITNPQFEVVDADEIETLHTGRIVPVYERARSITPKMQRKLVAEALEPLGADLPDPLPAEMRARLRLPTRHDALRLAHFPPVEAPLDELNLFRSAAQRRLILEEFFRFQVGLLLRRREADAERKGHTIRVDDRIREALRGVLPFKLTAGQRAALKQIGEDMQRPQPMNRLLQGDVGAGKTIVAVLAAVLAMENGLQAAFMAPTEILAEQHAQTIRRLLAGTRFRVELVTGGVPGGDAQDTWRARSRAGQVDLVIGTHALVQESTAFHALGLAIIDEQHRFGVLQRATLRAKGLRPDMLVMTATPIPRTLALTTYGDLDVSSIRDLPPGRQPIRTIAKPGSRRDEIHAFVRGELEAGPAGVRDLSDHRGVGEGRPARRHRDGRHAGARGVSGVSRGAAARADEAGRQGPRDAGVCLRRDPHAGVDDGRRGRRRRAQRDRDAGRARRAVRPRATASAARPRGPRRATSRRACWSTSTRSPSRRRTG